VHGDALRPADGAAAADQPVRLAHAVLNSHAVDETQAFFEQALGFVLADRTKHHGLHELQCDHHTHRLGDTDNDALNHIAFLMPDAGRR
jgi:catechol-2,3-dioxygenase